MKIDIVHDSIEKIIWNSLVEEGKFEIIDILHSVEQKKVKKIKIHKILHPDPIINNSIMSFMKRNGVEISYDEKYTGFHI